MGKSYITHALSKYWWHTYILIQTKLWHNKSTELFQFAWKIFFKSRNRWTNKSLSPYSSVTFCGSAYNDLTASILDQLGIHGEREQKYFVAGENIYKILLIICEIYFHIEVLHMGSFINWTLIEVQWFSDSISTAFLTPVELFVVNWNLNFRGFVFVVPFQQ